MRRVIEPMCQPNATLGLRAFFQMSIVILALIVAAGIVGILMILAHFLEKYQAGGTADWLNYAIAGAVIYHAEDLPVDAYLIEDDDSAGGNA